MPSGAKKRKAAKKKKEQIISSTNNHSHGNDDMKSRDERDIDGGDGGDVGSPASQVDHNHQHTFNHREEERKTAPSLVESHVIDEKSALDDVETACARIQHVEHDKSSSCSSSSDDESRAYEKKSNEDVYNFGSEETSYGNEDKLATLMSMEVAENGTHGDVNGNYAVEVAAVENSVKTMTEEVGNGTEISANKSVSDGVESRSNESETELFLPLNGTPPAETSNFEENTRDSEPHDSLVAGLHRWCREPHC